MTRLGRRRFLAVLAGVLAALPGAAWWWRSRQGRAGAAAATELDADTLRMFVDTLVPADETPGALDAGVFERLLPRLEDNGSERERWASALASLDAEAREAHGAGFADLDLDRRTSLLLDGNDGQATSEDDAEVEPEPDADTDDAREAARQRRGFVLRARRAVLRDYYAHPVGQAAVDYLPPLAGYPDYDAPPPRLPGTPR